MVLPPNSAGHTAAQSENIQRRNRARRRMRKRRRRCGLLSTRRRRRRLLLTRAGPLWGSEEGWRQQLCVMSDTPHPQRARAPSSCSAHARSASKHQVCVTQGRHQDESPAGGSAQGRNHVNLILHLQTNKLQFTFKIWLELVYCPHEENKLQGLRLITAPPAEITELCWSTCVKAGLFN